MNAGDIAFPNLGIYLKDVPKFFSIFGFEIAFYGLLIGLGVLSGIVMAAHVAKATGQNPDDYWDFAIYAVIFSIVGARIYYVVFSWDYYKDNLLGIFQLRNGGLAIYGGVIAAFVTLFVYCRVKKQNPLLMGDTCMPGLILGQAIGRWGNFMNREVFGEYYAGLFSMQLTVEELRATPLYVPGIFRRILPPIFRKGRITSMCIRLSSMKACGISWYFRRCLRSGSIRNSTVKCACSILAVMGWGVLSSKESGQTRCFFRVRRFRYHRSWHW